MDPSDIVATLRANEDKEFVRRVLDPALYPIQRNPDGSVSSHRMGSAEVDGRNIAFPTLVHDPRASSLRKPEDPVREAMNSGEYIEFRTPEQAQEFAEGQYKAGMGAGKGLMGDILNKMWR